MFYSRFKLVVCFVSMQKTCAFCLALPPHFNFKFNVPFFFDASIEKLINLKPLLNQGIIIFQILELVEKNMTSRVGSTALPYETISTGLYIILFVFKIFRFWIVHVPPEALKMLILSISMKLHSRCIVGTTNSFSDPKKRDPPDGGAKQNYSFNPL